MYKCTKDIGSGSKNRNNNSSNNMQSGKCTVKKRQARAAIKLNALVIPLFDI